MRSSQEKRSQDFLYWSLAGLSDVKVIYDDVLINNNKAAVRFTMTGTHKGWFLGIPPSNKQFKVQGMSLFVFNAAKCIERWELIDVLAMIEQLSPKQQISALMNNILEFAEGKQRA